MPRPFFYHFNGIEHRHNHICLKLHLYRVKPGIYVSTDANDVSGWKIVQCQRHNIRAAQFTTAYI